MKKNYVLLFLLILGCSLGANEKENVNTIDNDELLQDVVDENNINSKVLNSTSFTYIDRNLELVSENFTNKKTIIVFWADYWSICRRELPVLEAQLKNLNEEYDVIALAHSEYDPTIEWVNNNLNGELTIGFSTPELRDYFNIIGQPITIVLDTNGEIIFRDFGEVEFNNF